MIGTIAIVAAASAVLFVSAAPAMSLSIVLDIDQGWYNDDGVNEAANTNYLAGHCSVDGCGFQFAEYRNFFLFDLSSIDRRITGASLRLWLPEEGFVSPAGSETYQLFHVAISADEVGQRWGEDIFDDLGTGASYGSFTATESDEHTMIEIVLDEVAIADLNAAVGLFAFGGAVITLDAEINDELLFGNSGYQNAYLVLETVPVPTAAWLLGSAVLTLYRRRTRPVEDLRDAVTRTG